MQHQVQTRYKYLMTAKLIFARIGHAAERISAFCLRSSAFRSTASVLVQAVVITILMVLLFCVGLPVILWLMITWPVETPVTACLAYMVLSIRTGAALGVTALAAAAFMWAGLSVTLLVWLAVAAAAMGILRGGRVQA